MVDNATAATMTIAVAADRPPMKTKSAIHSWPSAIGRVNTKVSGSTSPPGKCSRPPNAIGRTKTLIARRYSGNSHIALIRCVSSVFSTTATWNWRGRQMIAAMARIVSIAHWP